MRCAFLLREWRMINYFYNIISKSDDCDLCSDVLTSVRKEFYLSREKQKNKLTQNSSGDSVYYEYSIEKDKPIKWVVSDDDNILSDCKNIEDGKYVINYYSEDGSIKLLTFSKYHTLLKVEYFDSINSSAPYCTIEPRKYGNGLCLLMSTKTSFQPSILYPMPDVDDEYIENKIDEEFEDYCAVASTNDGDVKFLTEEQQRLFEDFVDRAAAMKLTDTAPKSFIDEDDAVLAQKLNPKDFNIKRNLSQVVDMSKADCFSYDADEGILSELISDDVVDTIDELTYDASNTDNQLEIDVDATLAAFLNEEDNPVVYVKNEDAQPLETQAVAQPQLEQESDDEQEFSMITSLDDPDCVIESGSSKYLYYGQLDIANNRSGYGRTAAENGRTAYEGMYSDNKRNGVGAYYYKDGQLCYYGDWKNNKREGFGVGVSSFDKSVHVGEFIDNKPVGDGVRVANTGDVQFIRKTLSNGSVVLLKFDSDKLIITKYNKDGEEISENSSNLIYF